MDTVREKKVLLEIIRGLLDSKRLRKGISIDDIVACLGRDVAEFNQKHRLSTRLTQDEFQQLWSEFTEFLPHHFRSISSGRKVPGDTKPRVVRVVH